MNKSPFFIANYIRGDLMKQLIGFTGSLLLLFLVFSSLILPSIRISAKQKPDEPDVTTNTVTAEYPSIKDKYRLGESAGRVAAFYEGEDKPFFVSSTRVADLPEPDAESLKKGIVVETRQELGKLIEDICS